jgi:hypothetical protein
LATSFLCGEELRNGKGDGDGEGKMEIEILKWPKHVIFGASFVYSRSLNG